MQQATVNLLSDMGAQPATLQAGLVAGGALDTTAPTAAITDPTGGATVPGGNVTISGTAADTGGLVAAVEVSTDGGTTWGRATGTTNWTYTFSASNGTVTAQARAVDDAANIGTAASVTFDVAAQVCPCSIFAPVGDRNRGERHRRRRARRQVPIRSRGLHHRDPLLQDRGQHGHPHRHPLVDRRDEPGNRHVLR